MMKKVSKVDDPIGALNAIFDNEDDDNTRNKVVRFEEGKNEIFAVPRINWVDKELFWWTKEEIGQARQEAYMMAQIRVHVEQKLAQEAEFEDPEMLEDRIEEICLWEPGKIADYLQQPPPDKKEKIPARPKKAPTKSKWKQLNESSKKKMH